ncbi:MAG: NAD-dependent epimerase/dehydratase family protein [Dehalococcoidia bacterium]|nr:NAD-dependent epimerase/dehydratase family protein [Dehalococcoidia bacterium]
MSSRRTEALRVAVTGAVGYVGARLVEALAQRDEVERVVAIDVRPLPHPPPKVEVAVQDVAEPLDQLFRAERPHVVVHLAYLLNPGRDREAARRVNVGGTASVLAACAALLQGSGRTEGVKHVVYLSSTSVYGAHVDNPVPLTEEQVPRPVKGFAYSEDKVASERLLAEFATQHPETCVTVLRGPVVMGPHARNFIAQALTKPVMVGVLGCDPPMQFFHEDDLLDLLLHVIRQPKAGVYNFGGEGTVRYSEMVRMSGRPLVRLPAWVLYPLVQALWRLRLQNDSPACGLDFIRWPWVASTEKLRRETGFAARYTSKEALEAFVDGQKNT